MRIERLLGWGTCRKPERQDKADCRESVLW
jgi:hypothetical protein